jgi:D-alanyl-D-alanine carboxypeptidase
MPRRSLVRAMAAGAALLAVPLAFAAPATATTPAAPGAVAASSRQPAGVPTDRDLRAALDGLVAAGASGASLQVDDGRRSVRLAAGAARLDPRLPMRPDARIRVGSITKTFVATAVLQLAGERRLSLDDSVERWLPGLVPDGDGITLRQLLNHTSGIFNYTEEPGFIQAVLADPLREYTPRQLVAIATAHPPVFAPGTSWSYSNTNYIVLGLVVERVTHRAVSDVLRQRIIRPLHLRDTLLPVRYPDIPGHHARGYVPPSLSGELPPPVGVPNQYVDVTRISPTAAGAAGALISNPRDLRTFYRALLSGRLLRPAQQAELTATVEVDPDFGYGLGIYTANTPCGRIWGHDGGIPGYNTIAWNDGSGRRGFALGLPTETDEAIGAALDNALATATCRMLGRPVPAGAAGATTAVTRAEAGRPALLTAGDKWPYLTSP